MAPRPRPLSRVLDGLALLLVLPDWDREESRIILREVRPRLGAISDLAGRALEMDGLGQRIALRTISRLSRDCLRLIEEEWAPGDKAENACHRVSITHLRLVAGELDRGEGL